MSELRKLFTARFANNRPPPGESRLLRVASDPSQPQRPEEGPQGQKSEEADVTKLIGESQSKIEASLPGEMIRGFEEACVSTEWLQELFNRPGTAEAKLHEVLKAKGYPDADLQTLDPETLSPDVRRTITAEILRENPEFLVHLAESVERRIQQLPEVMTDIEKKIKSALEKKFEIKQEHVKILSAESVTTLARLSHALNQIPNERRSAIVTQLQSSKEVEMGEAEIASALGLPALQEQTKTERAIMDFIIQLKNAIHRKKKFGAWLWSGKQPESNEAYDQKQSSYREDLEKEQQALREYIDVELTQKTRQILKEHKATHDEICAKVANPDEAITQDELDSRLIETEGYGHKALLDAADTNLKPLDDLGLLQEGDERRIPKRSPNFLEFATEAFGVLEQRTAGKVLSLPNLLGRMKQHQQQLNEWAYETATKLRNLRQLPDGDRKNKIITFFRESDINWSFVTEQCDMFEPYILLKSDPKECERQLRANPSKRILVTDPEYDWFNRHDTEIVGGVPRSKPNKIPKIGILAMLLTALDTKPGAMLTAQQEFGRGKEEATKLGPDTEVSALILKTRGDLDSVLKQIRTSKHLSHPVCETVEIRRLLDGKKRQIQEMLPVSRTGTPVINNEVKQNLSLAVSEIRQLDESNKRLQSIEKNIVKKPLDENQAGYFEKGVIYINTNKNVKRQRAALRHEAGHAIIWAFKESFPFLLIEKLEKLKQQASPASSETFEQILQSLGNATPYQHVSAQMDVYRKEAEEKLTEQTDIEKETHRIYMEEMLEELVVRHSDWVQKGKPKRNGRDAKREQVLFEMLEKDSPFSSIKKRTCS